MINPIDKILTEWAYRVHNGMPDPSDNYHMVQLDEYLTELRVPRRFRETLLHRLREKRVKRNPGDIWKTKSGYAGKRKKDGKSRYGMGSQEVAQAYVDGKISGDDTESAGKSQTEGYIKRDHEKADTALYMKKSTYKKLSAEYKKLKKLEKKNKLSDEGKERLKELEEGGIGAGTPGSQAGECITHKAMRMRKEGKSWEEIQAHLEEIVSDPDHILYKKNTMGDGWVGAGIAAARKIEDEYGIDNIETIAWDTPEGRQSIGVSPDFKTASDMFVSVRDPKTGKIKKVGVSLKKDGAVFINNGGWDKQHAKIREGLKAAKDANGKPLLTQAELDYFDEQTNVESYEKDYDSKAKKGATAMRADKSPEAKKEHKKLMTDDAYAQKVFGPNYKEYRESIRDFDAFLAKMEAGRRPLGGDKQDYYSNNDSKAFAKLTANSEYFSKNPPGVYDSLRQCDHDLTERTMAALKNNPKLEQAVKIHILNSIHIDNILGLNKREEGDIDEFKMVYGIEPDGAMMDESTLITLFGPDFEKQLNEDIVEVKQGKMTLDQLKINLAKKITIDYDNHKILFNQTFKKIDPISGKEVLVESEYPLFDWHARAKGLGSAPAMELGQDPFLARSLKEGTPDIDRWDPKVHYNYLTGKITVLNKEIKENQSLGLPVGDLIKKRDEYSAKKKELKKRF